jgi:hypothetical protein
MTKQADENKRLAHARTLVAVAAGKMSRVPDNHPARRDLERKLGAIKDRLRVQEREAMPS